MRVKKRLAFVITFHYNQIIESDAGNPLPKELETMFNKTFLLGNLGRDPEVRALPSGKPVVNFSLATNRRWTDGEGNRQDQTEWHQIVCFGRLAEIAGQHLVRGKQVFVEGRIQTRSWESQQSGEKRYRTEIVCESFQMVGHRDSASSAAPQPPVDVYEEAAAEATV